MSKFHYKEVLQKEGFTEEDLTPVAKRKISRIGKLETRKRMVNGRVAKNPDDEKLKTELQEIVDEQNDLNDDICTIIMGLEKKPAPQETEEEKARKAELQRKKDEEQARRRKEMGDDEEEIARKKAEEEAAEAERKKKEGRSGGFSSGGVMDMF